MYVCYFYLIFIDVVWAQACWERRVVMNASVMKLPKPPNISSRLLQCLHCTYMQQRQPLPWRLLTRKWANVKEKEYMMH